MSQGRPAARFTTDLLPHPPVYFVDRLRALHRRLRDAILAVPADTAVNESSHVEQESDVVRDAVPGSDYLGDTIYRIDERGETALLEYCASWAAELRQPFVLVAEGLPGTGRQVFPRDADPADATFECIVDPIDGTRGLMYQKRSAWALTAVAPGRRALGRTPDLRHVAVAVQTELPTARARYADTLWAVLGGGAYGETLDLVDGSTRPMRITPSRATGLAHGFATISKFFPGTKEAACWLEERLFAEVVGEHAAGAPLVFDDEYISSGGQFYELMVGHDRFVADLRPVLMDLAEAHARDAGGNAPSVRRLCARPYDVCTALIATEAGVIIGDAWGQPLRESLDTGSDVAWTGYANVALRDCVQPVLTRLLMELGAAPPAGPGCRHGTTGSD